MTAPQWADLNRGILGDSAILPVGNRMNVQIQTANQITITDGVVVYDGREFYIGYGEYISVPITSGTQGMMRNDIVAVQYEKIQETGVETGSIVAIEGTPDASNPEDPVYSDMDIRTGVLQSQKPLCRVRINGTAIEGIDMLVKETSPIDSVIDSIISEALLKAYPVNSIYISVSPANPSNLFGGTWIRWGSGRVPVGVDTAQTDFATVEKTGGEKTHKLTTSEMPAHTHTVRQDVYNVGYGAGSTVLQYTAGTSGSTTSSTGGGNAHNNLQPYITCYMWKRTA